MKTLRCIILLTILFSSCKSKEENKIESIIKTETSQSFSEIEKTEIVTYYLIKGMKLTEKDFYKIIFLNDAFDGVKVINYEGKDAFFCFKFSEALKFYNTN